MYGSVHKYGPTTHVFTPEEVMHDCEVCGEQHDEQTHGEPETVLQPSLHRLDEYAFLILDEAEGRGITVSDLRGELDDDTDGEIVDDITTDALDRIRDAGYPVLEADDTLLIYPRVGQTV